MSSWQYHGRPRSPGARSGPLCGQRQEYNPGTVQDIVKARLLKGAEQLSLPLYLFSLCSGSHLGVCVNLEAHASKNHCFSGPAWRILYGELLSLRDYSKNGGRREEERLSK